jgi:hypothetical protein
MPKKRNPLSSRKFHLLIVYLCLILSPYSVSENPALPVSPQPQVRSREVGRVKDFPGGNIATSASRIAFLQSLCPLPKYLDLVDLVLPVVGALSSQGY